MPTQAMQAFLSSCNQQNRGVTPASLQQLKSDLHDSLPEVTDIGRRNTLHAVAIDSFFKVWLESGFADVAPLHNIAQSLEQRAFAPSFIDNALKEWAQLVGINYVPQQPSAASTGSAQQSHSNGEAEKILQDKSAWDMAQSINREEGYQHYIKKWPKGLFVNVAKTMLKQVLHDIEDVNLSSDEIKMLSYLSAHPSNFSWNFTDLRDNYRYILGWQNSGLWEAELFLGRLIAKKYINIKSGGKSGRGLVTITKLAQTILSKQ